MRVEASAPSNIALIKYMGKVDGSGNRPANASLSYTLDHLRSFVVIEPSIRPSDDWGPLPGFAELELSSKGRQKFLNHFARLKTHWGIAGHFKVLSANNFPSDCGLASSASSFAALTLATHALALEQGPGAVETAETLSQLSRQGSGSSCRSLFSPWAEWSGEGAAKLNLNLELEHAVIVVDGAKKQVSSSDAHARVNSSALWPGRVERAEARLEKLKAALALKAWPAAYELCWAEFWDMHALFETSQPSFGYMTDGTLKALNHVRALWQERQDGPLVTMDAGPNVHLLFRKDQVADAARWLSGFNAMRSWHE